MTEKQNNYKDTSTQLTSGQIWRERLEKTKGTNGSGASKNKADAFKIGNQSTNNTPKNSNRKSRKGLRPG